MKRSALLSALFLALALSGAAWALDPLPEVVQGPGYNTWTLQADLPLLKLEDALADLRSDDQIRYDAVLAALGIKKEYQGRGEWALPEIDAPVAVTTQFLSFDRRKLAVLTAPILGHHRWYAVILRQDGDGEDYWRAFEVFLFDTDPETGLGQSFPDILGDDIRYWKVDHAVKDDIYGRAQVSSIFKYDETGRMRLTYQELSDAYLSAKFMGRSLRLKQSLSFPGDQTIVRTLKLASYPWMRREEFEHYEDVDPGQVPPSKVWKLKETFAWDPADFDFYDPDQELYKLLNAPSPLVRGAAAVRLGEHLKTVPPGMARAVWKDKDPLVRIQVALALAEIGDPSALPALDKALRNWNEDDTVRDALQQAQARLQEDKAAAAAPSSPDAAAPADAPPADEQN
jgi:HEAT repeats